VSAACVAQQNCSQQGDPRAENGMITNMYTAAALMGSGADAKKKQ
jgi:hypothetical protein